MGQSVPFLIWTKARPSGDDTRCPGALPGWMRWLLAVCLIVVGESPETSEMSSIPGYEALLSAAQLSVSPDRLGSLPWENNNLLAEVFGDPVRLEPELKRPRVVHDFVPMVASASSSTGRSEDIKA